MAPDGVAEERMTRKVPAIVAAAMLVLTAFAAVPVAAAESVTVETDTPTDVTTSTATLHGTVTGLENASEATVWFEYWAEGDAANSTETTHLGISGTGSFAIDVVDLEENTTYVVVAHAETENATGVGAEVTFTTDAEEAVAVETGDATGVTETSATLNGELTTLAGAENASVWFEYWPEGDAANNTTTAVQTLDSTGTFTAAADGLSNDTTYVVVAHAETPNESDAGHEVEFTTHDRSDPLGVHTQHATAVGNHSATLNGELTGMEGAENATVWFEYWVEGHAANASTTANQTLSAPGSFSASLSGLENDTTYVYVAHAAANHSTAAGDEVEFTTGAGTDEAADRAWDGEGPFGQWLTSVLKHLVPSEMDVPFGQFVSDLVTANNPGNGQGPPEHAGPPDEDDEKERGPPDHAKGGDDEDALDVAVDGEIEPNATVTVTVTHNGSAVENATVILNDEVVGQTDADGQLEVALPEDLGDEVEIEVETEDAEGEWEHEFESEDDQAEDEDDDDDDERGPPEHAGQDDDEESDD